MTRFTAQRAYFWPYLAKNRQNRLNLVKITKKRGFGPLFGTEEGGGTPENDDFYTIF